MTKRKIGQPHKGWKSAAKMKYGTRAETIGGNEMSRLPEYIKDGWRPHGPGRCRCPKCGAAVSTNALARARHVCKPLDPLQSTRTLGRIIYGPEGSGWWEYE
jgi:hypothetical protein